VEYFTCPRSPGKKVHEEKKEERGAEIQGKLKGNRKATVHLSVNRQDESLVNEVSLPPQKKLRRGVD